MRVIENPRLRAALRYGIPFVLIPALVALCKALSSKPRLLIMDEPSKGLDANRKALLLEVIRRLKNDGVTVLLITHDVEFAALCADRCALFAQGRIAAVDRTDRFMTDNRF